MLRSCTMLTKTAEEGYSPTMCGETVDGCGLGARDYIQQVKAYLLVATVTSLVLRKESAASINNTLDEQVQWAKLKKAESKSSHHL